MCLGVLATRNNCQSDVSPDRGYRLFPRENGVYSLINPQNNKIMTKGQQDIGEPNNNPAPGLIWPAIDTRLTSSLSYVNPSSVQIFSAGLDTRYGHILAFTFKGTTWSVLAFPTGDNYQPYTYDDITNFSSGTLEDSIP